MEGHHRDVAGAILSLEPEAVEPVQVVAAVPLPVDDRQREVDRPPRLARPGRPVEDLIKRLRNWQIGIRIHFTDDFEPQIFKVSSDRTSPRLVSLVFRREGVSSLPFARMPLARSVSCRTGCPHGGSSAFSHLRSRSAAGIRHVHVGRTPQAVARIAAFVGPSEIFVGPSEFRS